MINLKLDSKQDHAFRGLDLLKNVKFPKEPSLKDYETAVKKDVGIRASIDASYVTMGQNAIFKAYVLLDGRQWLYLCFPQSILSEKYFVIGKKPLTNDNEGNIIDQVNFNIKQHQTQGEFKTNAFEALKQLRITTENVSQRR